MDHTFKMINNKPMKVKSLLPAVITVLPWLFPQISPVCNARPAPADTTSASYRILRAVEKNDSQTFQALLASDPTLIKTKEPGLDDPLLVWAARKNQPAMVALLLKSGADIHATNRLGSNPLHLAAFTGDYAMMELLINSGADFKERNLRGKTPVDYVSIGKNPRVFDLFLRKDKNILSEKTTDGATLLHLAANAGDTAGFSYLLGKGLDIRARDDNGSTVVLSALAGDNSGMIPFLNRQGADLDAGDNHGLNPLMWSVMDNNIEMARFLAGHGADVNHRDNAGVTPLILAANRDSLPMIEWLINQGAGIRAADKEGKTALHIASMTGNFPAASYLAGNHTLLNIRDNNGMTPLHLAAVYGYAGIGKTLLEKGADPSVTDNQGHDAAYYCDRYGNRQLCRYLSQIESKTNCSGEPDHVLAGNLSRGQAVVHYLNHSGYAIETRDYLLVFDYFQNRAKPSTPSLLNGRINAGELHGKKVIVFVSHEHGDHYDTAIWGWRRDIPDITYVLGFRPPTSQSYEYIAPREVKTLNGLTIHAIRSTDSGVGFFVEADGIVVYHPGDHVNKTKNLSADFKDEIDYLASLDKRVDIAFFPVEGCGFPGLEAVKTGNFYVIGQMKPDVCVAMHGEESSCAAFTKEITGKIRDQKTSYGIYPGDRFFYPSK